MASGSLKDLFKALTTTFSNPIAQPKSARSTNTAKPSAVLATETLPQDIHASITAFLDKHSKIDDANSQKVHEELLRIREIHVVPDPTKTAALLEILRLLRPAITGQPRTEEWWQITIKPILDGVRPKRVDFKQATAWVLDVLENGSGEKTEEERTRTSAAIANALLDAYLIRAQIGKNAEGRSSAEDDSVARQLESVLLAYGCERPKGFLLAIDRLFVQREHRLHALGLMCAFVGHQPPDLDQVKQTAVIEHLIKCLMIDTSTTVISLALATLVMFLPHIPSSVRTHLPRLFLIYSRLLCWEQQNPTFSSQPTMPQEENDSPRSDEGQIASPEEEQWEKLESSFDAAESTAPELLHFFTFLYGLYPLNFTSYIHKPRKYLKKINFPRAGEFDLDQSLIRKKSEQFRRVHLLHNSFFTTTLEDEQQDDRWLKIDAVDVVAECLGLCIATSESLPEPGPPPTGKLPDLPKTQPKDNGDSLKPDALRAPVRSNSTPGTPSTLGSPLSSALDDDDDSPTIPSFPSVTRRSVSPSPSSSASPRIGPVSRAQMQRSPALRPAPAEEGKTEYLQREVILLKSDLNFERYLKQQHLSHIGQLQRRTIKEATVEAETQNLINKNRSLKAQLSKSNDLYASLKKETATGRNQSRRLESDLSTKVRSLKEDEKKWTAEEETLRVELSKAKKECDQLRELVVKSESKELLAQQELQFAQVKLEQLDTLKKRIVELEETIRIYQGRELEFMRSKAEKDKLRQKIDTANLTIKSREASAERAAKNFDRRIRDLEARLAFAQNPVAGDSAGQYSPVVQTLIDSAIAGVTAKYTALKKEYATLRHRHVELDMRCHELQDALDSGEGSTVPSQARPYDDDSAVYQTHYGSAPAKTHGISALRALQRPKTSPRPQDSLDSDYGAGAHTLPADFGVPNMKSLDPSLSLRDASPMGSAKEKDLGRQHPYSPGIGSSNAALNPPPPKFDAESAISKWSHDSSWDEASTVGKSGKEKAGVKDALRVKGRGVTPSTGKKKEDGDQSGASASGGKRKGLSGLLGRG